MRLVYSPYDGGYYWERYDFVQSQLFRTEEEARRALREGLCVWEE